MPPRVVRPRSDRANWIACAVAGSVALTAGYAAARRVFNPGSQQGALGAEGGEGAGEPADGAGLRAGASADAGAGPVAAVPRADAGVASAAGAAAQPVPAVPSVPVRVVRSVAQSCGDGDELTLQGDECNNVPALEAALRRHLQRLGTCPSARAAAATPEASLAIGLRVDLARRRVTALLGRGSTVRDSLTYAACASSALRDVEDVWQLHPPHRRYLYYFTVRFGPLAPGTPPSPTPSPDVEASPTAPPAAVPAPAPVAPPTRVATPSTPAVTPGASTGTPAASDPEFHPMPLRRPLSAVVTAQPRALVREVPRTGAVIARLPPGTAVEMVAHDGSWYQVRWPHGTGWVFGGALSRQE